MPERYICIHGHFYQPPRENPWLESIELQDSAYPYHDWNERISAECYAPNGASRLLDDKGRIANIVNNYAKMSFNFGPTLLSWIESNAPAVYRAMLDADRDSQQLFSGHGSALAQVYNHVIMPLANRRDKYTQVLWGIRDFQSRFQRRPEGMWLSETAVNVDTLEVLAELGINFTILAPQQAKQVRLLGDNRWRDVTGGRIDTTMAYALPLPSGRTIHVFFFDGSIHRAVTSDALLSKGGDEFAARLLGAFSEDREWAQLVNMAADGETYGHHHDFGDMALAYALHHIESNNLARITNYGEYLSKHPPTWQVEIIDDTSWTCDHGIERWRSDCGCSSGRRGWNQAWRGPLRQSLDWLRDTLAPAYEKNAGRLLRDPWAARDEYIDVVLDRSQPSLDRFFAKHATRPLSQEETNRALELLEMQRHAMLMYTSCGWYFDEISRIETVQIIQYAARVVQLSRELFGDPIEPKFLELLGEAKSNIQTHRDGRWVYENLVLPGVVDLNKVAAHYAVSSLFEEYSEHSQIYSYNVDLADYRLIEAGRARLAVGRADVANIMTLDSATVSFGVLHLGDHNINAGVREYQGEDAYQQMVSELSETFNVAEFPEVIRAMDRHFGESNYSIRSLFKDEQRKVLAQVLDSTLAGVEAMYRQQYEVNYPLMRFFVDLGNPIPWSLHPAADFVLNSDLSSILGQEPLDRERILGLLEDAKSFDIKLDTEGLALLFQRTLERIVERLTEEPQELPLLRQAVDAAELAQSMPFEIELWQVQNLYHKLTHDSYPDLLRRVGANDPDSETWLAQFAALGGHLSVRIE